MGRSVDEDMAIKIVAYECGEFAGLAKEIEKQIKALPSAQPERKSGKWKYIKNVWVNHSVKICRCSACNQPSYGAKNFCPNCGAKMEAESNG